MKHAMVAAAALTVAGGLFSAGAAAAGEVFVGLYEHDVKFIGESLGIGAGGREDGVDLHLGYRTDRVESLSWMWRPQVHAFVSINSENTSNFAAVGFSWPIALGERFYVRPGMGLAYTDGEADLPKANAPGLTPEEYARRLNLKNTRINFGSQVLFEPELALGWRINDRLSAELSYIHLSHGQILGSGTNQGLDDVGVRVIYSF